jgi:LacI family transcriptional regulator
MKVTLHEVAARAEVSIATVSRALNGLPVSLKSQARVVQAVAELGYVANEAARALRSDRTLTMGMIFFDLKNALALDLVDALGEAIEAGGYSLLIASARGDAHRYDLLMHRFLERRVDALFCINPRGESPSLARYLNAPAPVIALFGAGGAFADLPLLSPSFSESGKRLAQDLKSLGHRRVGLLLGKAPVGAVAGIADTLRAEGLAVQRLQPTEAGGMNQVLAEIRAAEPAITAVVALDLQAHGVMAACMAADVSIPGDLSLIAVNEIGADRRSRALGVSSLVVDPHHMGHAAGAAMLAWLAGSRPAQRTLVQAATWNPRASLGPAPSL